MLSHKDAKMLIHSIQYKNTQSLKYLMKYEVSREIFMKNEINLGIALVKSITESDLNVIEIIF